MRGKFKLIVGCTILILISTLVSHAMSIRPSVAETVHAASTDEAEETASLENPTLTKWQAYEDTDYAFTLEYPKSWQAEITIDVPHSSPKPEWVLRRHSFISDEGTLDLDIWMSQGMKLSAWLEWMGEITAPFPVTEPNAQVAGYPAVAFVENEMATVFFSDGKHVYRLWYTAIHNEDGLKAFRHLLNTFHLSKSMVADAHIPKSVIESTRQLIETRADCTTTTGNCESVYGQGCCGLSSTACSTHFPCSRENGVDKGNCTWYTCYRYGWVPFVGDAGGWWNQVPNYWAWDRGSSPYPYRENIAWWGGNPGHVAYVTDYMGGAPNIYEMNWCWTCERQRPSYLSQPQGYMWALYY